MSRMHKSNPKFPTGQQNKRSVVTIQQGDVAQWLAGSLEDIKALLVAPATDLIDAGPV